MTGLHAVVLAAGRGSRLGELTEDRPKPMVELAGKPLIRWQAEALRAAGAQTVSVVRGYRGECFPPDLASYIDNPRWETSNMVVSLLCAAPLLESGPCLVSYGDIVYRPSIPSRLAACGAPLGIAYDTLWERLWSARFSDPLADAETFREEGGWLKEIGARAAGLEHIGGQYMGLLRFTPQGFERVRAFLDGLSREQVDRLDMTALLSRLLDRGERIAAVPVDGGWCEVDSREDLELYERLVAGPAGNWTHDWREPEAGS